VRDQTAEAAALGPLGVDVDRVPVAGEVGEPEHVVRADRDRPAREALPDLDAVVGAVPDRQGLQGLGHLARGSTRRRSAAAFRDHERTAIALSVIRTRRAGSGTKS
jgi:hypothetical protein